MNLPAILHDPLTDACPLDGRMHLRLRTARGDFAAVRVHYSCNKYEWWQRRETTYMRLAFTDSGFDYFAVEIPLTDTRFAYIFELEPVYGQHLWLSEEGVSPLCDFSLSYFNFFQYTSMFPQDLAAVPAWVRGVTGYQIFPERFDRGLPASEKGYVTSAWTDLPAPKSFFGGDLEGIRRRLPYLQRLGVGLLYLTPVFVSPSNHKYDTVDYEHVDPHFGGDEALRALIRDAHAAGMRVMLDGVFNHCSSSHPFFLDAMERGSASPYFDWFFIDTDKGGRPTGYRTFAAVRSMPKLNTAHPAVIDYFCRVARMWMREYGADAWRLDVSDEISHRFLRAFRESVTAENPDALIIGEDWHNPRRSLCGDEYDSLMNYAFTKACLDLFAFETITPRDFCDRLIRLFHRTNPAVAWKQYNLLDSHDTDRFLTRVGGDRRRHRAALALLFFYPGIPFVYYGDEIGLEGGYDPDCRRTFCWEEEKQDSGTLELVRYLAGLRRRPALSRGTFAIDERDGVLTLTRTAPAERISLTVNCGHGEKNGLWPYEFHITEHKGGTRK